TDVVNAVLEKECEAIVLTDSSKFGAVHSYSIGPGERFNRVITDSKIRASDLMHLEQSKLTVHVVDI
nr:DeoR family transcriptional regulator [Escherichia coli]